MYSDAKIAVDTAENEPSKVSSFILTQAIEFRILVCIPPKLARGRFPSAVASLASWPRSAPWAGQWTARVANFGK